MDFDKLKATGLEYAERGKKAAQGLTERARIETRILSDQTKLTRAQRELGALVYSLAKNGESNQPLMDKYIDEISALEQEIEQLRASVSSGATVVPEGAEAEAAEESAARVCPQCGAEVPEGALFCSKCGSQL